MITCQLHDLGFIKYSDAWALQKQLFDLNIENKIKSKETDFHLLVCEHNPVYTMGKSTDKNNLLVSNTFLEENNIELFQIERGGDITYHGPGQIVIYPIFDLEKLKIGVKEYVYLIEKTIIDTLSVFGLKSERIESKIGIWLDKEGANERKIAAIGIKCSRYITMHGLALNVNTDLNYFNNLVPCGIVDKGVTSMQKELGEQLDFNVVKTCLINKFSTIFELKFK